MEGEDGAEAGLAALVGLRQQPVQLRPRLGDTATEGKLDRGGAVDRDLIEAGVSGHPGHAFGQLFHRITTQDAGPGERLPRMPRDLRSGRFGEPARLGRQRFSFADPLDPDQTQQ